ncbi:hypothetical protein J4437_07725 [Candidatus Woesearchaeota archaeon]|nr:hypothetical protein [Candidatus Woesearchaeota archaeon]
MQKNTSLKIILIISIAGILFSGYLSYNELFKQTCPIGQCSNLFSIPVCVYGLVMYLIIFIVALFGLLKSKK